MQGSASGIISDITRSQPPAMKCIYLYGLRQVGETEDATAPFWTSSAMISSSLESAQRILRCMQTPVRNWDSLRSDRTCFRISDSSVIPFEGCLKNIMGPCPVRRFASELSLAILIIYVLKAGVRERRRNEQRKQHSEIRTEQKCRRDGRHWRT